MNVSSLKSSQLKSKKVSTAHRGVPVGARTPVRSIRKFDESINKAVKTKAGVSTFLKAKPAKEKIPKESKYKDYKMISFTNEIQEGIVGYLNSLQSKLEIEQKLVARCLGEFSQ